MYQYCLNTKHTSKYSTLHRILTELWDVSQLRRLLTSGVVKLFPKVTTRFVGCPFTSFVYESNDPDRGRTGSLRSGINVRARRFCNKCIVNKRKNKTDNYIWLLFQKKKTDNFEPLGPNLINVRSGIRSVRVGKRTKINKRTGYYYSSP